MVRTPDGAVPSTHLIPSNESESREHATSWSPNLTLLLEMDSQQRAVALCLLQMYFLRIPEHFSIAVSEVASFS